MSSLGEPTGDLTGAAAGAERRTSIWPHVEERVLDLIEAHRSTIVFANSRRLAERLTARLNELAGERAGRRAWTTERRPPAAGDGRSPAPATRPASRRRRPRPPRLGVPRAARAGRGGAQGRPAARRRRHLHRSNSASTWARSTWSSRSSRRRRSPSGLQRVGRAGHQVGAVSAGVIFPKYRGDLRRVRRRRRADARRARSSRCATRATRWTCWPSRSSRWWRWTR